MAEVIQKGPDVKFGVLDDLETIISLKCLVGNSITENDTFLSLLRSFK